MKNQGMVVRQHRRAQQRLLPPPAGWIPPADETEDDGPVVSDYEVVVHPREPQKTPKQEPTTSTPRSTTPRRSAKPQAGPNTGSTPKALPAWQSPSAQTQQAATGAGGTTQSSTPSSSGSTALPPPDYTRRLTPDDEDWVVAEAYARREAAQARRSAAEKNERDAKKARTFISRILFAWFGLTLFACGLAASQWLCESLRITTGQAVYGTLIVMVLLQAVFWAMLYGNVGAKALNRTFGQTMSTNNRWAFCMIVLTIIMLWVSYNTPRGLDQAYETGRNLAEQINRETEDIRQQMRRNAYANGAYETDVELEGIKSKVPVENIRLSSAVPNDPQRERWHIRAFVFLALLVITLIYCLFFALSDEAWTYVQNFWAWMYEKAEGDPVKAAASGVAKAAPIVAASAIGIGPGGDTIVGALGREATSKAVVDTSAKVAKRAWNRLRQSLRP